MGLGKKLSSLTKPELEEVKDFCNLTESEEMVFDLIAKGKSIIQIADICGMSESTVSNRIRDIKSKCKKM